MTGALADLITHADGRQYLREGRCDGCARSGLIPGACCTFLILPLARPLSEDETYWVNLHPGVLTRGVDVRIEVPCSALKDGSCVLFGRPERPQVCVRYPEQLDQLIEGCSYLFTEARS